jgi:TonB family protein
MRDFKSLRHDLLRGLDCSTHAAILATYFVSVVDGYGATFAARKTAAAPTRHHTPTFTPHPKRNGRGMGCQVIPLCLRENTLRRKIREHFAPKVLPLRAGGPSLSLHQKAARSECKIPCRMSEDYPRMLYALTFLGVIASSTASTLALTQTATPCNTEVTVIMAVQPGLPRVHLNSKVSVEASVAVGSDGTVKSVEVLKSSGYKEIDAEVIAAASQSKYKPKMVDCQPVDGTFLLRVDFGP